MYTENKEVLCVLLRGSALTCLKESKTEPQKKWGSLP